MNIFLSCTKEKASSRCKAKDMYMPSSLFSKAYTYAKSLKPDKMYILSAKHHLLPLSREIDPYNYTLKDASAEEKKEWTEEVVKQCKRAGIDFNAKTLFFCGDDYIQYLKEHFPHSKSMFAGKGIGEIMHWLDGKIGKDKANESLSERVERCLNEELFEKLMEEYNEELFE